MEINVEIPDSTKCAFMNIVFFDKHRQEMMLGTLSIGTNDIKSGFKKCEIEELT